MAKDLNKETEKKIRIVSLIGAELICEGGVTLSYGDIVECTEEFAKPLIEKGFVKVLSTKEV